MKKSTFTLILFFSSVILYAQQNELMFHSLGSQHGLTYSAVRDILQDSKGYIWIALPFNSVRFLTTAIVSEMGYSSGLHRQVLFTIGLVLFVFIMIINIVLNKILKKGADDNE